MAHIKCADKEGPAPGAVWEPQQRKGKRTDSISRGLDREKRQQQGLGRQGSSRSAPGEEEKGLEEAAMMPKCPKGKPAEDIRAHRAVRQ